MLATYDDSCRFRVGVISLKRSGATSTHFNKPWPLAMLSERPIWKHLLPPIPGHAHFE